MGAIVDSDVSDLMLTTPDKTVEMHATVLSTITNSPDNGLDENMETDENTGTIIHTAIMVESMKPVEIVEQKKIIDHKTRFASLIDSDSESDDNGTGNVMYIKPKAKLFDSDSDLDDKRSDDEAASLTHDEKTKVKVKKMTGKEAQIQRLEIASASQRRLRETRLSLPYHKPKQRTLKEFLKNRPKITEPLPEDLKHMSTINAIKLASSRTPEISKKLEEREKILEKFYKSSSESEAEEDKPEEMEESVISATNEEQAKIENTNADKVNNENSIENLAQNDEDELHNKDGLNVTETEEPASIQGILNELQIDYSIFKHELIMSFLKPSKLTAKVESDIKSFEDQDMEETELISEFELNKIIDTLNTEDSSSKSAEDQLDIEELSNNSKFYGSNRADLWQDGKCFDELSESDKENEVEFKKTESINEKVPLMNINLITPRLTGGKSQIIDLDEDVFEKNKGVNKLVERFMQHNARKSMSPKVVQVRVVTEDVGGFKEEKLLLPVRQEDDDERSPLNEKPGAKLMRLREDLQRKIAQRRTIDWQRKQKEAKELLGVAEEEDEEDEFDAIYKNEKEDCCSEKTKDDGTDGDDEAEDEEAESEEDELEVKETKRRKKSEFVDDEAEESDEEDDESSNDEEDVIVRPRRRIQEHVEDSSDSDKETPRENVPKKESQVKQAAEESPATKSQNDMFGSQSKNDCEGEEFPLCQQQILKTPLSKNTSIQESEDNFLSPVQQFTALQNFSADSKTIQSPNCTYTIPHEPSPLKNEKYSPKQLFCDSKIPNTQENLNELMDLCSGKFTDSSQALTLQSQSVDFTLTPDADWTTQKIISEGQNTQTVNLRESSEIENNGNKKLFTSDDESELELKTITTKGSKTPLPTRNELLTLASSSDDESVVEVTKKRKFVKKKPVQLFCSDDENSENGNSDFSSNEEGIDDNEEAIEIAYDSEENEITVVQKPKINDFFDAEAELSEDEHMGSGDESEEDLDEMEQEEGDFDKINDKKVKRQLEKIHMKRILEEDKRDVRILQELLLEDGDLHSDKGRQRQFKWKNTMDSELGNDENLQPLDDESEYIDNDELEVDEKWRKNRFEREKLLKEQRLKEKLDPSDIDLVIEGDSILKLGQTKLRTSGVTTDFRRTSIEKCCPALNGVSSQDIKKPLGLTNKKGSFLTRGQSTLARLAAATTKANEIIGGVKNSRNFVFQTLDAPANNKNSEHDNVTKNVINGKRKAADLDSTPLMFKKLRVADSLDKKVSSRVKQLLNNS